MSTWVLRGTIPGGGASAVANFLGRQTLGVVQTVVGDFGRFPISLGVLVSESPKKLLVPQVVGISLSALASGTAANPQQNVGVSVVEKNSGLITPPVSIGADIQQWVTNLTQTTNAISATSTGTWTNPNNGTGPNNGVFATNANTLTQAASGAVTYLFASQFNKTDLTISLVHLDIFWRYQAGLTAPGTYLGEYSFDGIVWSTIRGASTSFDASTTFDRSVLTSQVGQDWSKLSNLRVRLTHTAGASVTPSTLSIDSCRLIVNASRTDLL